MTSTLNPALAQGFTGDFWNTAMLGKIMSTTFVPVQDCRFTGVCDPCLETSSAGAFVTACTNIPHPSSSPPRSYLRCITEPAAEPQQRSDSTVATTPNRPPRPSQEGQAEARKEPRKRKRAPNVRPPALRVLDRAEVLPPREEDDEEKEVTAPPAPDDAPPVLFAAPPAPDDAPPVLFAAPPEHDPLCEREMSLEFCDEPYEDPTETFFRQDSTEIAKEMYSAAELEEQERRLGLLCESVVGDMSP